MCTRVSRLRNSTEKPAVTLAGWGKNRLFLFINFKTFNPLLYLLSQPQNLSRLTIHFLHKFHVDKIYAPIHFLCPLQSGRDDQKLNLDNYIWMRPFARSEE